jgi:hypothetical protein
MDLPPEASVCLEIARRTQVQRFGLGTVARPSRLVDVPLAGFDDPDGVLGRIKVTSGAPTPGRLLAVADKLRPVSSPSNEPGGRPLLRFRSDDGLGQLPWMLDLSDGDPVVVLNNKLGDWHAAASSEPFVALVYPEVLRQIAVWIGTSVAGGDDVEGPLADWVGFARQIGHDPMTLGQDADDDAIRAWANLVASRFAAEHQLADRAMAALIGEGA